METITKIASLIASLVLCATVSACSWDVSSVNNPESIVDPETIETPAGVLGVYRASVNSFSSAFAGGDIQGNRSFAYASALAGDELVTNSDYLISLRRLGIGGDVADGNIETPWFLIHRARLYLDQAIGGARKWSDAIPASTLVHMYAMRGYLSIFIGELYCSGVPFSRAIYDGDIELGTPNSTEQVFQRAIADFDSALAIPTDSAQYRNLATIGKARALLNLARFAEAATLVQGIPTSFNYQMRYASTFTNFMNAPIGITIGDRLGINGLDYGSAGWAGDPRVRSAYSFVTYSDVPAKYANTSDPVTLADGLEARLIEAEAMLQNDNIAGWAGMLNALRLQGSSTPMDTLTSDSTVNAADTLRENVMFRERAFWLYATGHRFGDLRRKVRQYHRPFNQVFTVGTHPTISGAQSAYSGNANLAPPRSEVERNPNYLGCFDRNA